MSQPTTYIVRKPLETLELQTIASYAGASLRQGDPRRGIDGIITDSRLDRPGALFLALRGDRFDGHRFVAESAKKGTAGAVVERGFFSSALPPDYALLEVDDTLRAYQCIAASYRRTLRAKVVAITGSNGKTSTKDFTAAVLSRKYRVLKTEGNLNNHIGVPQTLLRAVAADEMIVLELGMNHPGEIAPLAALARPDVGVITNIGTAHIEFMGSRAGIAQEKGMLAEAIGAEGLVILPTSDEFSASIAARTAGHVVMVGGGKASIRAETIEQHLGGSRFTLIVDGERIPAAVPVPGRHMVTNALLAVAAGLAYGVPLQECVSALSTVQLTKGRMELKHVHGLQILDDSYNANPDSMIAALETLSRMPTAQRRIAVLGKMGELGEASESGHRRVGESAAREQISCIIGVGPEAEIIVRSAHDAGLHQAFTVSGTEQAAELLHTIAQEGDVILIKGSRSAAMERVVKLLAELRADDRPADASTPAILSNAP